MHNDEVIDDLLNQVAKLKAERDALWAAVMESLDAAIDAARVKP